MPAPALASGSDPRLTTTPQMLLQPKQNSLSEYACPTPRVSTKAVACSVTLSERRALPLNMASRKMSASSLAASGCGDAPAGVVTDRNDTVACYEAVLKVVCACTCTCLMQCSEVLVRGWK